MAAECTRRALTREVDSLVLCRGRRTARAWVAPRVTGKRGGKRRDIVAAVLSSGVAGGLGVPDADLGSGGADAGRMSRDRANSRSEHPRGGGGRGARRRGDSRGTRRA